MKQLKSLVLAVICGVAGVAHAKVITVDNNAGSVAMHSSLQAAIDSAATGDTILIAGSPNSYGTVYVGRRLNFSGPGYFLGEHNVAGINSNSASVGSFNLRRRDLQNATGCTFSGLSCTVNFEDAGITGVSIDKCRISGNGIGNPWGGLFSISRCWLDGGIGLSVFGSSIRNSVIGSSLSLENGTTATNCVVRDFNYAYQINTKAGSSISNTVFITSTAVSLSKEAFAAGCKGSISHCLAVSGPGPSGEPSYLPAGLGNNPTIHLFYDAFTGGIQDKAYYLIDDSPAKGTGFDGVDMGIFSGARPYIISGLAQIPRITRFVVPSKATSSSGLRIEMDAEAF
ncbi:MAG: hypothetical protein RLZZ245_2310 [Verrucomicrobiota bacterium]|jgi:hypothetical protein